MKHQLLLSEFLSSEPPRKETYYRWCCPLCPHMLKKEYSGHVTLPFICPCCKVHGHKQAMILVKFTDDVTSLSVLTNPPVETSILGRITLT